MHYDYIVYGYHGCDERTWENIKNNIQNFKPSKNDYDWLGEGIYFWENDPLRAKKWGKKDSPNPIILEAAIFLGNCLDFSRSDHIELLATVYKLYETVKKKANQIVPENMPGFKDDLDNIKRYKDCDVINFAYKFYSKNYNKIDVIRSPFMEGKGIYSGTCFTEKQHIQLCVKDVSCIKNINCIYV